MQIILSVLYYYSFYIKKKITQFLIAYFLWIHRCTRKMGSLNGLKITGGPRNFPVLLIFCILTNAIQRTTARDEPTTTDTTATADRRSRDSSLITNILYLAWKCLHSPDDVFCLFIKNIFLPYIWSGNMQLISCQICQLWEKTIYN